MIHLSELKNMMMYKKKFHLPILDEKKRKGSSVFLLTPSIESSINMMKHPMTINLYHNGYYIERDIMYIAKESAISKSNDMVIKESSISIKDNEETKSFIFRGINDDVISEGTMNYKSELKKILYDDRMRTPKDIITIQNTVLDAMKTPAVDNGTIVDKSYLTLNRYKGFNIFVDLFYYNKSYYNNAIYKLDKGIELYSEMISRLIYDPRLLENGYLLKTVFVPLVDWANELKVNNLHLYSESVNPISTIYRLISQDSERLKELWKDTTFVFFGNNGYFKTKFSEFNRKDLQKFLQYVNNLSDPGFIPADTDENSITVNNTETNKSMVTKIVDMIEKSSRGTIKVNNLTGTGNETEEDLLKRIEDAASKSSDVEEAIDKLENDAEVKKLIAAASTYGETDIPTMTASRSKRMLELDATAIDLSNKSVSPISEIPVTKLSIDSPNEEWKSLTFQNFDGFYANHYMQQDITDAAYFFNKKNKKMPVGVVGFSIEDTSNSEDYKKTYIFEMEDYTGTRFTLKLDIPELKDDKFLVLKGNEKTFAKQIMLLPIAKTDPDTVQIVSNYKKIFISRFGNKTYCRSDLIIKGLTKLVDAKTPNVKVIYGDCSRLNSKYVVTMDYEELSKEYSRIEIGDHIIYLNQNEIRSLYNLKEVKGSYPIAWDKKQKIALYANYTDNEAHKVIESIISIYLVEKNPKALELYRNVPLAKKYAYSRASILSAKVPVIVLLSYNEGLEKVLTKAKVEYEFVESKNKVAPDHYSYDYIKFKDGYLKYYVTLESSLLLNGLKECNTEDYEIAALNSKLTYLDWLDIFGGRILADGIDNFYELMIDPITDSILSECGLPTDYTEVIIHANNLLIDTDYLSHVDMRSRRIRSNEIISATAYKVLAESYGDYKREKRRNPKARMTIKQTAVTDELLKLNTVADASILNAALEAETINAVSYKGPSGLNSERAYGLDKRAFDKTMLGIIGMSTVPAANVGVARQLTIDPNVYGARGYVKVSNDDNELYTSSKLFTIVEAMKPFGPTRDDPPRTAMTFVQTRHGMRVKDSSPLLVTNGADMALPYMLSNTFIHKTKDSGTVIEKTDDCMILKYSNGNTELVNLVSDVKKNSSSGFYVTIRLETSLKKGSKFKANEIIAHDPLSFSGTVGPTNDLAYTGGTFAKFAIINTADGFEDSGIISDRLSEKMSSDVVIKKEIILSKTANIYKMVKVGQEIQEGESLLIIQNTANDEDLSILLRNLVDDEDAITELGRVPIKSKISGTVEAIKIYRTAELDELSPSLLKAVKEVEAPIKKLKSVMTKYDVPNANRYREPNYKLDQTGKLKGVEDGVLIEFYLKYKDKVSVGDKFTFFVALKAIVKDIFPIGEEPYTDFRPTEQIDSLLALGGTQSRMIFSIKIHMMINKGLVELSRQVKDILGIDYEIK